MGGRLLASWLKRPLLSCPEIERRQNAIAAFLTSPEKSEEARLCLAQVRDMERLMMKIVARMASPRDLYALGISLSHLPSLKEALLTIGSPEITTPTRSSMLKCSLKKSSLR